MKFIKTTLVLILSAVSYTLFAQDSADAIINDYFTAIGGRDKIAQINSVYMEGTMEVMGNSGQSKMTLLNGKGYKSEIDFGGQSVVQVITADSGWMINPFMGSPNATSMPKEQYLMSKDQIYVGGPLLNYKNTGYNVQLTGMENIDGKPAYKIEGMSKDSIKSTYYIDSATHYLTQLVREYQGQATTAKYSDFRKTDFGNTIAFSEQITVPQGMQLSYTITKAEVNKPVEASIFDMPKQ